jgi:hypothetical protein
MKTNYKDYEISIEQDDNPLNPREDANLGRMFCRHPRYHLGDEPQADRTEVLDILEGRRKDVVALPLFLYDHSGITMNTTGFSCPWDSGMVGTIYADYKKIRSWLGVKRITKAVIEKVKESLRSEVQVYDDYISGNVYGYVITKNGEQMKSCWGYNYDDAFNEAKAMVDNMMSHQGMATA